MSGANLGRSQLGRMFQLILALRGERYPNATALARECEVSTRTIYRDLTTLELAGVPVRYVPERQGYQLGPGFGLSPPKLAIDECQAVVLGLLLSGINDRLGLGAQSRAAAAKLIESLPEPERGQLRGLQGKLRRAGMNGAATRTRGSVVSPLLVGIACNLQVDAWVKAGEQAAGARLRLTPCYLMDDGLRCVLYASRADRPRLVAIPVASLERVELTDLPGRIVREEDSEVGGFLSVAHDDGKELPAARDFSDTPMTEAQRELREVAEVLKSRGEGKLVERLERVAASLGASHEPGRLEGSMAVVDMADHSVRMLPRCAGA